MRRVFKFLRGLAWLVAYPVAFISGILFFRFGMDLGNGRYLPAGTPAVCVKTVQDYVCVLPQDRLEPIVIKTGLVLVVALIGCLALWLTSPTTGKQPAI